MRPSIAIALTLVACGNANHQDSSREGAPSAPATPPAAAARPAAAPAPKRPLDTRPLPALAADPGGATGKPLGGVGVGGLGLDVPTDVALGPSGEAYVCGYFDAAIDAGPAGKLAPTPADPPKPGTAAARTPPTPSDAFLARIERDGKIAWIKRWGDKRDDVARAVAVHGDTIVVVGNFLDRLDIGERPATSRNPASGSDDLYAAAFDAHGNVRWIWTVGGIDSDGANAVAAAPDGGWYVGGSFRKTIQVNGVEYQAQGRTDALLVKLGPDGKAQWVKQLGGPFEETIMHLASDPRGNVYAFGHFRDRSDWGGGALAGGGEGNDLVLAKYDANGDHLWSKRFGDRLDDAAGGLAVDPAGNATIVGTFSKAISFGDGDQHVAYGRDDMFVARLSTDGALAWAKTYGSDREDGAAGVAADAAGNTVMTGWFADTIDFGKTTQGVSKTHGNKDVFAIKHDKDGAVVWVQTWGDKDHDQGRAVALDDQGGVVVAGLYRFTLAAVTPPLESVRAPGDRIPKPDTFVLRLAR